jgi:hypothetical protein
MTITPLASLRRGLTTLGDELSHTRRVHRVHRRIVDLEAQFDLAETKAERAVISERIASLVDSQADRVAASRLARVATGLTAQARRQDADLWRQLAEGLWADAAKENAR